MHPQRSLLMLKAVIWGWWPRLTVGSSRLGKKTLWILLFGAPLSLIFIFSNATTDSRTVSRSRWKGGGGRTIAVSDEQWGAADYAELQMNGRKVRELLPCTMPERAGFQVSHTAEDCSPVQGAKGGRQRCFSSLSTRSISPGVMARDGFFPATNPESPGAQLSFDRSKNYWAQRGDRRPSRDCEKIMAWCWCLSDGISFSKSLSRVKGQSSLNGQHISEEVIMRSNTTENN